MCTVTLHRYGARTLPYSRHPGRARSGHLAFRVLRSLVSFARRFDPAAYALWAALHTLASARAFYGSMLRQTGGDWSAPLDDVFIHFDYARSTALGHPFEWTVGNGYSSGNTSLTYPFVLAMGFGAGFRGRSLMMWAAIVAACSVFGVLLATRRLFLFSYETPGVPGWNRAVSYVLPPAFLAVGALDWSLWSGMEVAFFLGVWALCLLAWLRLDTAGATLRLGAPNLALALGLASALLVATRPEGLVAALVFSASAAWRQKPAWRGWRGWRRSATVLSLTTLPVALLLAAQAVANLHFTGESSANGAIVKLAIHNPYMSLATKLEDWWNNATYATLRGVDYHFANSRGETLEGLLPTSWASASPIARLVHDARWVGIFPIALATLPLLYPSTRRIAIVLWAHIVGWIALVSFNGQVHWQNERYIMPAVAWLIILAALGVSVSCAATRTAGRPSRVAAAFLFFTLVQAARALDRPDGNLPQLPHAWTPALAFALVLVAAHAVWPVRAGLAWLMVFLAWDHQGPNMRDQRWFFGRAARNVRDQHLTLGRYLADRHPRRVLVGDAGAILYESEAPGLDIVGLGGYRNLPFARASVHGLPATLELIERMPEQDRPDVLAIFPTWWGPLPAWFAGPVLRSFPVEGNVICGGYEHNVYPADWHLLGTGARRLLPDEGEHIAMEVDTADLVSEAQAHYAFDRPSNGWTDMHVFPHPRHPAEDVFDAGRRLEYRRWEEFALQDVADRVAARLIVRTVTESRAWVHVTLDGEDVGTLDLPPHLGWDEPGIDLPAERVHRGAVVRLFNEGPGDFVDYHLWVTQ